MNGLGKGSTQLQAVFQAAPCQHAWSHPQGRPHVALYVAPGHVERGEGFRAVIISKHLNRALKAVSGSSTDL